MLQKPDSHGPANGPWFFLVILSTLWLFNIAMEAMAHENS